MFWNWIHLVAYVSKLFYTSPSPLQKYLFIDNNTTHILQHTIIHYPSFQHSIILKLHHFCCLKHIFISFFISHTKSSFLESNITNVIIQKKKKTIPVATFTTFNLHLSISYFCLFYKTHFSQNTNTYFSYISKLHVSQSIHIQDLCPIKYLHIILIHITDTISHNIYIFLTISTHLKIYQTLFQELITKSPFLWKTKTYKIKSPSYGRQYHSYLTKN